MVTADEPFDPAVAFPGLPDEAESARRLKEHGPSALPVPAPGLAVGAPLLYLDQKVWVWLLKASPDAVAQRRRLETAVESAAVVVVLSAAHWAETWHRGDWRSRWHLARLMWDTTRLAALAPAHALQRSEVRHALRGAGVPAPVTDEPPVVGTGVDHAFASPTGRLTTHASLGPDGPTGPPIPFEEQSQAARDVQRSVRGTWPYEWFSLAGFPGDMRGDGLDMRTHRRAGREFADSERTIAGVLRRRGPGVTVGQALTAHDLGWIWDDMSASCADAGVDANAFLQRLAGLGGRPLVEEFVQAMPTFGVLHGLRALRHENPEQPWHDNDRQDLLALSVAAAHCRTVVTERHWSHLLRRLAADGRPVSRAFPSLAAALDDLTL